MRLFIRNTATGKYLQQDASSWDEACSAWDFDDMSDLVHLIQNTDHANIELVLCLLNEPSEHDITIDFPTLSQMCKKQAAA